MTAAKSPLQVAIPSVSELTDNTARLLQQQLAQAMQSGNPTVFTAQDLDLARSNTQAQAFVLGAGLHGAYRYMRDFLARQAVPNKSTGEFLDGWLATYRLPRKLASAASGGAGGTGVAASLLAAGTLLQTSGGVQYQVSTAAAVNALGVITINIVALVQGAAGNLPAGTALALVSPVSGVDSAFTVDSVGLTTGTDTESDDEAIYRLEQRLGNEPMGGSPADYARWALQVAGITRAWGVRNPNGACTAGVVIMADNNAGGLASAAQALAVHDYIKDPLRGPPDELFVIVPTPAPVNIQLHLTPDTPAIRAVVVAELTNLFYRETYPGASLPHSHLVEAVSIASGEFTHQFIAPAITSGGYLTVPDYQHLLTLGTVTFI